MQNQAIVEQPNRWISPRKIECLLSFLGVSEALALKNISHLQWCNEVFGLEFIEINLAVLTFYDCNFEIANCLPAICTVHVGDNPETV
jgi:hypothetical protein